MIIIQFILQQLSPAKFCGFLLKTGQAKIKQKFVRKLKQKKCKTSSKCLKMKSTPFA